MAYLKLFGNYANHFVWVNGEGKMIKDFFQKLGILLACGLIVAAYVMPILYHLNALNWLFFNHDIKGAAVGKALRLIEAYQKIIFVKRWFFVS